MMRFALLFLLLTTPAFAQTSEPSAASPAGAPEGGCFVKPAVAPACPNLALTGEATMGSVTYGSAQLRAWRPGVDRDRTLLVYLGNVDPSGAVRYAPKPVPIARHCLDDHARPRAEMRFVRPEGLLRLDDAAPGDPGTWFVELRFADRNGAETAVAIALGWVRMSHWPVTAAGAETNKGKIRGRRERMHAGMN